MKGILKRQQNSPANNQLLQLSNDGLSDEDLADLVELSISTDSDLTVSQKDQEKATNLIKKRGDRIAKENIVKNENEFI